MKKLLFLAVAMVFMLSSSAQEQDIILHTATGDLYGTVLTPQATGAIPVVVLIAGSGPTDRDGNNPQMKNNSLKMIAQALGEAGIASVRYDKRGIAASKSSLAKEEDVSLDNYINDANEWVELLAKDKRFSDIIIAGHSEGSLIGMAAAAKNAKIKKFISIAGAGESMDKVLKRQLATQPQPILDIINPILDKLVKGDTVGNVSPLLYALFRPSVQPYLISCFKRDPAKIIATLRIPVLLVQGTTDVQVLESDVKALKAAYPQSKEAVITGMNHVLKSCDGKTPMEQMSCYTNPELPLHPELMPALIGFIK